jgi:uncharacterized Zn finger protein (UPF0148 family)
MGFLDSFSPFLAEAGGKLWDSLTSDPSLEIFDNANGVAVEGLKKLVTKQTGMFQLRYQNVLPRVGTPDYDKAMLEQLKIIGADQTPETLYGQLYLALGVCVENSKKPRPYSFCNAYCCRSRETCEACAERRKRIIEMINGMENPEQYRSFFVITPGMSKNVGMECHFCGAPLESKTGECPYCGTVISSGRRVNAQGKYRVASESEIPQPAEMVMELIAEENALDFQTEEIIRANYICAAMSEIVFLHMKMDYKKSAESSGKVQRALREKNYEKEDYLDYAAASAYEVQQMAGKCGMTVPQYLRGLLSDPAILSYRQSSRRENITGRVEQYRQNMAAAAAAINSANAAYAGAAAPAPVSSGSSTTTTTARRSGSYSLLDAREQRSKGQSYGYMGSAHGSCCGTCSYYVAATKECLQNKFRHPSGPNDYCGSYRS